MKNNNSNPHNEHVYFVNQLYRDFLLPTILGEDNNSILYWAGKRLARHYDLASFDDVASFFATAEFGDLTQIKAKRTMIIYELSGQSVSDRLASDSSEFTLESGILAEAIQKETGRSTECELKILPKAKKVQITANLS